jgi:hypothetical protein
MAEPVDEQQFYWHLAEGLALACLRPERPNFLRIQVWNAIFTFSGGFCSEDDFCALDHTRHAHSQL